MQENAIIERTFGGAIWRANISGQIKKIWGHGDWHS